MRVVRRGADRTTLTPEVRAFLTQPSPLIIAKSALRSTVHRRVHMDYVGVKTFDPRGRLTGERRFVGLFTSTAYSALPADIPFLRHKVEHVLAGSGLPRNGHDGKALQHILDTFPRDELFQIGEDELLATALGILNLGERPKVRVFLRFDRFDRYVSALVYVPRERYNTQVRERIHAILSRVFNGYASSAHPMLDEEALARVHYIVGREPGQRPKPTCANSKAKSATPSAPGMTALATRLPSNTARPKRRSLRAAMPAHSRLAIATSLRPPKPWTTSHRSRACCPNAAPAARSPPASSKCAGDTPSTVHLKLFVKGGFIPLSDCLPVFENLGLKVIAEDAFALTPQARAGAGEMVALHSLHMQRADGTHADLERLKPLLEDAFHAVWDGRADSDGFNRLVSAAQMTWRDVSILRAVAKFLRQTGFALSQTYVEGALTKNPDIAGYLVQLFRTLHDPDAFADMETRERAAAHMREQRIDGALNDVPSADDDRILRALRSIIEAMLRTNFFQSEDSGAPKPYVAFKLASRKLDLLPAPKPLYEIFVYAPDVEGVHLRFGKVARGGIRWSDRARGFPHRDPGPGESAAGEERRHRAGGRQGRLLSQAPAGERDARCGAGGRHRRLQDLHRRAARRHRQSRPRRQCRAAGRCRAL